MKPPKQTVPQVLNALERKMCFRVLAHVQARRARDEVIQGLLLASLTSAPVVTTDQDALLTADQVAKKLGVKRGRVYELLRSGDIPPVKIGQRQVRVSRRDLNEYVQRSRTS